MKWGTFIGVDHANRKVKGANQEEMVMEQYMDAQGIKDPRDVIGPFETIIGDMYDGADSGGIPSGKELHEKALEMARKKQKEIAEKLKG